MQGQHRRESTDVTENRPPPAANRPAAQLKEVDKQPQLDALSRVANHRDKAALARLADYYAPRLFAFACQKTADEQLAREIVQDTLLAIWHKAVTFDQDKGSLTTWIYTIARNLCFDAGRRKLARISLVSADALYDQTRPAEIAVDGPESKPLDRRKVRQLLSDLPPGQRQVVALVYLDELTHQEAAIRLGVPVGTVKSRLRLGLAKLAERVNRRDFGYDD